MTELQSKGHDIIIGGDFNEALQDKNSGVLQIATRHHLVDPFLHKFPQYKEFGTHESGRRRIDIVLVSPAILPCIQAIGYAPFQHANDSDHRPLFIDLNTSLLFGNRSHPLTPAIGRTVKSKDKTIVTKYISTLYDELQRHKVFQLQSSIDVDSATPLVLEQVDRILGTGEATAERKCQPRRPEFYSLKLVQQRIEVSLLRRHLTALQRDQDRSAQLLNQMRRTGVTIVLPPTQSLTRQALHEAQTKLRETCKASFDTRQTELEQRIQDISNRNQKPHQKILQSIKKTEMHLKTSIQILKAIRNSDAGKVTLTQLEIPTSWPPPSQTITSVANLEDPKTCSDWKLIRDPSAIEYYLTLRNRLHF